MQHLDTAFDKTSERSNRISLGRVLIIDIQEDGESDDCAL
jgi:hypothetical protein